MQVLLIHNKSHLDPNEVYCHDMLIIQMIELETLMLKTASSTKRTALILGQW